MKKETDRQVCSVKLGVREAQKRKKERILN